MKSKRQPTYKKVVCLSKPQEKELKNLSIVTGLSVSELIRRAVDEYLGSRINYKEKLHNFVCKKCGWKAYPGAIIFSDKNRNAKCPKCGTLL